ncbi:MAG: DUF11 domain-containing protein [Saprospirales bacterium]|nr:DUF11 domain-containing protein [Saprospirales bacterium]
MGCVNSITGISNGAVDVNNDDVPTAQDTSKVTILAQADLSVTKTDGTPTYTPGTTVTYTVVVSNAGPAGLTGASVVDNAPAGTTITGWTAVFAGGATGNAMGMGNINESIDIPSGGSVTYTINISVPSNYTGNLVNTRDCNGQSDGPDAGQ